MGGPCRIRLATGSKKAPACTDNFQLRRFDFGGAAWHSVEQCYQAHKFVDGTPAREKIRLSVPRVGESASGHGMRCWSAGQTGGGALREDWDAVKVRTFLLRARNVPSSP